MKLFYNLLDLSCSGILLLDAPPTENPSIIQKYFKKKHEFI